MPVECIGIHCLYAIVIIIIIHRQSSRWRQYWILLFQHSLSISNVSEFFIWRANDVMDHYGSVISNGRSSLLRMNLVHHFNALLLEWQLFSFVVYYFTALYITCITRDAFANDIFKICFSNDVRFSVQRFMYFPTLDHRGWLLCSLEIKWNSQN